MNKRKIGTEKEALAGKFLIDNGIKIVAYNFRTRYGEIDIIGIDGSRSFSDNYFETGDTYNGKEQIKTWVFFEVKYRKSTTKGNPLEAVDYHKQRKICKVADYYRMQHGIHDFVAVRFDVIAILGDEITWIKNAFPYRR